MKKRRIKTEIESDKHSHWQLDGSQSLTTGIGHGIMASWNFQWIIF